MPYCIWCCQPYTPHPRVAKLGKFCCTGCKTEFFYFIHNERPGKEEEWDSDDEMNPFKLPNGGD